jgi:hypothetical protein
MKGNSVKRNVRFTAKCGIVFLLLFFYQAAAAARISIDCKDVVGARGEPFVWRLSEVKPNARKAGLPGKEVSIFRCAP